MLEDYIKEKINADPRLVWLSSHDQVIPGARIYHLAANKDWAHTASLSTDGLQALAPDAAKAALDVRFEDMLTNLFGKGA